MAEKNRRRRRKKKKIPPLKLKMALALIFSLFSGLKCDDVEDDDTNEYGANNK